MKALSIKEPWASLIIYGGKDTENRSWKSTHIGPLVICTSLKMESGTGMGWKRLEYVLENTNLSHKNYNILSKLFHKTEINLGMALGAIDLISCDREMKSDWDEENCWHWRLAVPKAFDMPFRIKGQMGLFNISDKLIKDKGIIEK